MHFLPISIIFHMYRHTIAWTEQNCSSVENKSRGYTVYREHVIIHQGFWHQTSLYGWNYQRKTTYEARVSSPLSERVFANAWSTASWSFYGGQFDLHQLVFFPNSHFSLPYRHGSTVALETKHFICLILSEGTTYTQKRWPMQLFTKQLQRWRKEMMRSKIVWQCNSNLLHCLFKLISRRLSYSSILRVWIFPVESADYSQKCLRYAYIPMSVKNYFFLASYQMTRNVGFDT